MRLVDPTDFQILKTLSDGRRDTAANLAVIIDKDRNYLNTRLPVLADEELIERVGPAESSGLYQITPRGVAAAQNQSLYATDRDQFETTIDEQEPLITITDPTVHQASVDHTDSRLLSFSRR
ncbi:ArsR family transcriptional regulator [Halorubrum halophilum]|uniref:ArsR family transcriptional regulator n=1 Tax=Halorubrum halophilum TaxID=413816 RepID=UPI001D008F6B|nr:ArsR family transcriptional regulator [Halorubrum halophilum]